MKKCPGYWPDPGTPCLRLMTSAGKCPKSTQAGHGYLAEDRDLDPRWDWMNVRTFSDSGPVWIKSACKHLTPEPVETLDPVTGDVLLVARLCLDCDTTLWRWGDDLVDAYSDPRLTGEAEPNGFERWAYGDARMVVDLPPMSREDASAFVEKFRDGLAQERPVILPSQMGDAMDSADLRFVREFPGWVWNQVTFTWDVVKDCAFLFYVLGFVGFMVMAAKGVFG